MTADNWVNLFLVLVIFVLCMRIRRYWVTGDRGTRLCMLVLGSICAVGWIVDTIVSAIW